MILLDLFCGAGGAGEGYRRVGFDVIGVDHVAQPRYPSTFYREDAMRVLDHLVRCWSGKGEAWALGHRIDLIHASPPCQASSRLSALHDIDWPELIPPTREALMAIGVPWVIENVDTAALSSHPQLDGRGGVLLCGSMFGLGAEGGYLRRHRKFEMSFQVAQPACRHRGPAVGVYGHGGVTGRHRMLYRPEAEQAMQIDWMNHRELTQAIPPAYTEHIGREALTHLAAR